MMTESKEYMLYVLILYKNTILTESRKKNETVTFRLADNKSEIKFDIAWLTALNTVEFES